MKYNYFDIMVSKFCMILLSITVIFIVIHPMSHAQTLNSFDSTYTAKKEGDESRCFIYTPKPMPIPSLSPTPKSNQQPTYVPTTLHSTNLLLVDPINGPYKTIQAAYDAAKMGDTVIVKNGSYPALSISKGIKLSVHPDSIVQPKIAGITIQAGVENWLVQGFDITGGAVDGFKVYSGSGKIRNNWIHGNKSQGILIPDASDIIIEGNTIEYNGLNPIQCNSGLNVNPRKHCHGIYMSNVRGLGGPDRITIRNNIIRGAAGRGIQWNGDNTGMQQKMTDSLIENNLIEKCSWGMALWANADNNTIRNNVISTLDYPQTEDTEHPCIGIYSSNGNTISGNKCTSSFRGSLGGGIGQYYFGGGANIFTNNTFFHYAELRWLTPVLP